MPKKDIPEDIPETDTQETETKPEPKKTQKKDETALLSALDAPVSPKTAIDL